MTVNPRMALDRLGEHAEAAHDALKSARCPKTFYFSQTRLSVNEQSYHESVDAVGGEQIPVCVREEGSGQQRRCMSVCTVRAITRQSRGIGFWRTRGS